MKTDDLIEAICRRNPMTADSLGLSISPEELERVHRKVGEHFVRELAIDIPTIGDILDFILGPQLFIVKSGDGYLLRFVNDTPLLTSDPVEATRLPIEKAGDMITRLAELGFDGELAKLRLEEVV